jgi:AraC family transcriptional regulator of arabinose operon
MFSAGGNARLAFFRDGENKPIGKVERSIAYMMENTNRPLRVSTLAALVNLSPSRYFELFKRQMGCTPKYYFTLLRMSHACRMLGSTSTRVKEVAAALGYNDPLYFSRVFKTVHNVPPSRYKHSYQSSEMNGT